MTIGESLKSHFKKIGVTQKDMAEKLGVSQGYVALMLGDKQPFGRAAAKKWQEAFGINASWLMTGEGSMMLDGQNVDGRIVDMSSHHVSGDGSVVASGGSVVNREPAGMEVSLLRQNEMLLRQNEMMARSLDRLTRQIGLLMSGGRSQDGGNDGVDVQ